VRAALGPESALGREGAPELVQDDASNESHRAPTRPQIIAAARAWIGTPYLHQASAKGKGADCLGLVRGVWRELYGREPEAPPPYTPDWNERFAAQGQEPLLEAARRNLVEIPPTERKPGDVLVFRIVKGGPAKHCGILTEEDRFIHAYAGRCVLESWLSRWWIERIAGAFRFPGVAEC
jgi:NlpC/P60 family putative phage cell wall peptidase